MIDLEKLEKILQVLTLALLIGLFFVTQNYNRPSVMAWNIQVSIEEKRQMAHKLKQSTGAHSTAQLAKVSH